MFTKSQEVIPSPPMFSPGYLSWSSRHISRVRLPVKAVKRNRGILRSLFLYFFWFAYVGEGGGGKGVLEEGLFVEKVLLNVSNMPNVSND